MPGMLGREMGREEALAGGAEAPPPSLESQSMVKVVLGMRWDAVSSAADQWRKWTEHK